MPGGPRALRSRQRAADAVADEARLLAALDLELEARHDVQPAAVELVDRDDLRAGADAAAGRHRRREADLVPAVVDAELEAARRTRVRRKPSTSDSVRLPWAIVVPNGLSFFARSTSTWIHWSSPEISANESIISWVTSRQSLGPISLPISSRRPSAPVDLDECHCARHPIRSVIRPAAPPAAARRAPRPRRAAP